MSASLYAIDVRNAETGESQDWLWNVTADTPEAALVASDRYLRQLGWPVGWRSVKAFRIGPGIVLAKGEAIVEDVLPGTPEWDDSEATLGEERAREYHELRPRRRRR